LWLDATPRDNIQSSRYSYSIASSQLNRQDIKELRSKEERGRSKGGARKEQGRSKEGARKEQGRSNGGARKNQGRIKEESRKDQGRSSKGGVTSNDKEEQV
jgi:hypothetical protein